LDSVEEVEEVEDEDGEQKKTEGDVGTDELHDSVLEMTEAGVRAHVEESDSEHAHVGQDVHET
jgi:hypothetical protein